MTRSEGPWWDEMLSLMRALTGAQTAAEAARQMGVSRKTFYERAQRLLEGAEKALARKPAGRPRTARDTEKETLLERVRQLELEKLELQRRMRVREILQQARVEDGKGTKKKAGPAGRRVGGRRNRAL
jgi:transposase